VSADQAGWSREDEEEIRRLLVECVYLIDHNMADKVPDLWVDEGVQALGDNVMNGKKEIAAWAAKRATQERQSLHVVSNMRITPTGPDRAESVAYMVVYMQDPGGPTPEAPLGVGEYRDEFVRRDGRWYFISRRTVSVGHR
jgi:hypothetical protein